MKQTIYTSCNCHNCRTQSDSKTKGEHKKRAHRKFRRQGKLNPEDILVVSTGYKV